MFSFIEDAIENTLSVAGGTFDLMLGESGPTKKQVAKLISDGLTVVAIAKGFGLAESVIEKLLSAEE